MARAPLLQLSSISLTFGGNPLYDGLDLTVQEGDRVALVGRNGSGKSTLMKVMAGLVEADTGNRIVPTGTRVGYMEQEPDLSAFATLGDYAASGLAEAERYRIEMVAEGLKFRPDAPVATASGGERRRAALAKLLAEAPELMLLDEPTNHLDIQAIGWLEDYLRETKPTLFFVTHDRAFLRKIATRIVELDRGRLAGWACDYDTYLVRKQQVLEEEEKQRAAFDKKLAQEEEWIRRGVKAQRSRATARINALKAMRAEARARRERVGNANLKLAEAERSGQKVVEAEKISYTWGGGRTLLRDFSITINRGEKIGILGPNGAGKTTLIKLLLGQLQPTSGVIKHGTNLEVVYFDQLRAQIDDSKTVADNIANGNPTVTIEGRTRNVISYLQDFLFEPTRARTPARVLSGGERNRLLLAKLFTQPANVLVLDEPTNDLDAETLDLLEDLLVEFNGTLLLVSHDREFLDEVVTSTLVFEGEGRIGDYVGGYSDWQAELKKQAARAKTGEGVRSTEKRDAAGVGGVSSPREAKAVGGKKLSNKERAELDTLPARIEALEKEQTELAAKLSDPIFYKTAGAKFAEVKARLEAVEREHAQAFARWEDLESRKG